MQWNVEVQVSVLINWQFSRYWVQWTWINKQFWRGERCYRTSAETRCKGFIHLNLKTGSVFVLRVVRWLHVIEDDKYCICVLVHYLKDELFCCCWTRTLCRLESCECASAEISLDGVIKSAATLTFFTDTLISTALIVHEGPSVFRIFHRWQAVNQQWKVLNYDKSLDSDDLKDVTVDRTVPQPGQGYQTGMGVSTSTSSLMVVASTAAGSTSTTVVTSAGGFGAHVDPENGSAVPDQHCPYSILHLLSHLRQPETRSQPSNSTRELVMRVTTVWWVSWGLISLGGKRFLRLTVSRKHCLNCFGLIQCSCLFWNTSLMSLH